MTAKKVQCKKWAETDELFCSTHAKWMYQPTPDLPPCTDTGGATQIPEKEASQTHPTLIALTKSNPTFVQTDLC
jgi:hypothetical protein